MMRRTPMKRTPFKRAAPATKSHSNQAAALTSQALTAIKTRAPLRASTYAAPTEPAAPIAKSAPVRSEALRRAVASLPCINCGVPGHSQCAHSNSGKGAGIKASDLDSFPLCTVHPGADGRLVQGCHERFDQGALFSKLVRRELEPVWAADTQRRIHAMGIWPKALPIQQFSTGDDFERTLKNRT